MYPAGTHVQAQWGDGFFYGGTIVQFNGAQYLVAWDDGDTPEWVDQYALTPDGGGMAPGVGMMGGAVMKAAGGMMGGIAPGTTVQAVWNNGQWYPATVQSFDGVNYLVAWHDGSAPSWVAANMVQVAGGGAFGQVAAAPMMKQAFGGGYGPGTHVSAQWSDGGWYGGTIINVGSGMYEIAWDDGSPPMWVGSHQVAPG